jgi:hypothetical protein
VLHALHEIAYDAGNSGSLFYHERLARKARMNLVLARIDGTFKELQQLSDDLNVVAEDDFTASWKSDMPQFERVGPLCETLSGDTSDLSTLFRELGTLTLCNIDDRLKFILNQAQDKERSSSVLYSWDELEVELADGQDVRIEGGYPLLNLYVESPLTNIP